MIMRILKERQYKILVDGSQRLTLRNRKIEKPVEETEDKEEDEDEVVCPSGTCP